MPPGESGLIEELRARDFGVTCLTGHGSQGPVQVAFTIVRRRELPRVLDLVEATQPEAFYAVDEVTTVSEGVFPGVAAAPTALKGAWDRWKQRERLAEETCRN
jgi:hypothetical protein